LKKRGEDDGKAKRPAASESEMAAGYVSVSVFMAGLELRNSVLLQTGRALRRINKLFGSALRTDVAQPTPLTQASKDPFWITPATSMDTLSTEAIRSYLNLLAGLYSGAQTEATLAVGFYNRVAGKWQFADIEKPLLDEPVREK
jgi:hypothetical protein